MGAAKTPIAEARLKGRVRGRNVVCGCGWNPLWGNALHFVEQIPALPHRELLKEFCRAPAVIHGACGFDKGPWSLGRLVAVTPIMRKPMVAARIDQLEEIG